MTIACDFLTSRQFPFLFFLGNMGSSFFVGRQKERSDNRRDFCLFIHSQSTASLSLFYTGGCAKLISITVKETSVFNIEYTFSVILICYVLWHQTPV